MDMENSYINNIIKQGTRLKEKFLPIVDKDGNTLKILRIKKVYHLNQNGTRFFLFIIKNNIKKPKLKYLLAISLASQSSDFLVSLAKEYAIKHSLKLLQYPLFPKSLRINLILLKEITNFTHTQETIKLFKEIYNKYHKKIEKLKHLIEIE